MFYAHFVLAKKGPLARIWLAAHWDKKLTKAHVFETNIESSVEGIIQPKVKMALRTSGHLLLGIVRIYSRKAKYLLADCNEAFIKIKIAFRPGVVDLPEGNREAAVAAITLPEVFHDFDSALPDITIDMDAQVSLNQSRAEDITLKEDYGNLSLMADDGFDDMGFDEPEGARDATNMDDGFDHATLLLCGGDPSVEQNDMNAAGASGTSGAKAKVSLDAPLRDDGFGGTVGEGLLDGDTGALFEPAGLFDDAPLGTVELDQPPPEPNAEVVENVPPPPPPAVEEDSDDDMYDMAPGSMGAPSPPSSPDSPGPSLETEQGPEPHQVAVRPEDPLMDNFGVDLPSQSEAVPDFSPEPPMPPPPPPGPSHPLDHTTLINNDAESFALAPLDATVHHGAERAVKAKRKRKLVVDEVKSISGEEMKSQLSDTRDIVATLDLAPPTKRLMHWKETGGVEKLFSLPGHRILSRAISRAYLRHLTTRSMENEKVGDEEQVDLEEIERARDEELAAQEHQQKRMRLDSTGGLPHDLSQFGSHLGALEASGARPPSYSPLPHPSLVDFNFPTMGDDLPHLPHHMQGDQGPPLHSIIPSIPNDTLPVHPSEHMFESIAPLPHPSVDQHQLHHQVEQLHHQPREQHPHIQQVPTMDHPSMSNMVDDEATQLCLDASYVQNVRNQEHFQPPPEIPLGIVTNGAVHPPMEQQIPVAPPVMAVQQPPTPRTASNMIFDSLLGDIVPQEEPQPIQQEPEQELQNHEEANMAQVQNQNNELPMSDDDDYGAPASVGPCIPDEQMADETYEQFEERILTKRTTHMLHLIHNHLEDGHPVSFENLVRNNRRKQVAQKFYTFLVLKKQQAVELEQEPYGDLVITKGPKYGAVYNGN